MSLENTIVNALPLVGGASGLALLIYMAVMIHFARKKDVTLQELRLDVAELKGLVLGTSRSSHSTKSKRREGDGRRRRPPLLMTLPSLFPPRGR